MIYRQRPEKPAFLAERKKRKDGAERSNEEHWSLQYEAKRSKSNNGDTFQWAKYKNEKVNDLLLPHLKEMTQDHCAFCDSFPVERTGVEIEHFRPKTKFPKLSYVWENLFYCCRQCNKEKGDNFDDSLLKPDEEGYDFNYYFEQKTEGERIFLFPHPNRSLEEQNKARKTIEIYGLNKHGRPEDRFREEIKHNKSKTVLTIDDFSYRYLFL